MTGKLSRVEPWLHFSEELQKILREDEARGFRGNAYRYCSDAYHSLAASLDPSIRNLMRLDRYGLLTAIDSAYLDLKRSSDFHTYHVGPAPIRKAAALASWIGRLRPIQLRGASYSTHAFLANPLFSMMVGWSVLCQALMPAERSRALGRLKGHPLMDQMLYTVVWRAPDFRQLTLTFGFLWHEMVDGAVGSGTEAA